MYSRFLARAYRFGSFRNPAPVHDSSNMATRGFQLFSWLRILGFQPSPRAKFFRRLFGEALEHRYLLTAVSWDGGGNDFNWDNPLNWNADVLPGISDDVVIDQSGITITHAANVNERINSLSSQANLDWQAGTLTAAGQVHLQNSKATIAGVYQAGSTLVENFADLTLNGVVTGLGDVRVGFHGKLNLTPAVAQTLTVPSVSLFFGSVEGIDSLVVTGQILCDRDGSINVTGTTTVQGGITWTGGEFGLGNGQLINLGQVTQSGNLYVSNGAQIDNRGTWKFTDNGSIILVNHSEPCPIFSNSGILVKSGGDGITTVQMELFNSGSVIVETGQLKLDCGYVQVVGSGGDTGTITGDFTGEVSIANPGEFTVEPTPTPPPPVAGYTQTVTGSLSE